jgi:hypothetical protein
MLDDSVRNRVILYQDREDREGRIRYKDLLIELGDNRLVSLAEALHEEQERVQEFNRIANRLTQKIEKLNPYYDLIDADPHGHYLECERRRHGLADMPYTKRIQALNTYYTVHPEHARILTELTRHLLAGSEGDHSPHLISLMQRAVDMICRVMRSIPRKSKRAAAIHPIEAARGAARNGLRELSIIPTLLHDIIEEKLDLWTEELIEHELEDPRYGEYTGKRMKDVPVQLRHRIIGKHLDAYNDHASGIYFEIALSLFDHVRYFPTPHRYHESLHSIMEIIAALSRRRDMSYYAYLQGLLYPKADAPLDGIERSRLLQELAAIFPNAERLLDDYLAQVQNFYETGLGEFSAKEEVRRNAFREILVKILDRLNNTRDMDRGLGFSIPKRLYGTGFKNIFFLQALEDKLRRPSFNTEERRLIEVKFLNKPKVAALYQILDDIEFLGREFLGREMMEFLEREIDRYRCTRSFRRLTPPGRSGYFNGLIYLFNEITLGRKSSLVELEKRRDKQAEVLVAFKAVLEAYLVYPALIREDQAAQGFHRHSQSEYRPYRIEGMGPGLEARSDARKEQGVELLNLKTFSRHVI